ncbi:MAG TPA: ABC transporter permease subunit [Verrucomicrobiae bacterium]|jgi:iron(III) transport system permease protein|nr:ABC transporter permease subunit [Verrucomicrobiae bacterium]
MHLTAGHVVMAAVLLVLGYFLVWPVLLLLINSFNAAGDWFVEPRVWGLRHWQNAFLRPGLLKSLGNSLLIWSLTVTFSFPIGVAIAWLLARTRTPYSHSLEFMFWIAYMVPTLPTTIAWISLLDPDLGLINVGLTKLGLFAQGPFNIFSVPGIVWANLMGHGIAIKVMLLTPAFRNMDSALEEAARVGGAGNLRTLFRVTLPLMLPPMMLVLALQLLRIFQSFETEYLLGMPFGFYVYSTKIFALIRDPVPNYGEATVLASMTLLLIALIIPVQRWILERRRYTTVTGSFRPGLIDMGRWNYVAFGAIALLLMLLTVGPLCILVLGSFMTRIGYFMLGFTLEHWKLVLNDPVFIKALDTTLILGTTAAVISPLLFSIIAYILVRTHLPGRGALDLMVWCSGAVPGILAGLGLLWLFLGTPGLSFLFGTIWALIIVVILQGKTTGVNVMKGLFVQIGADMEEAARVSGAGWLRTYFRIWLPLLMPALMLIAVMNFVSAASATGSIILLASRDTMTLSLMALELSSIAISNREAASIISIFIIVLTVTGAIVVRALGGRIGVRARVSAAPDLAHVTESTVVESRR